MGLALEPQLLEWVAMRRTLILDGDGARGLLEGGPMLCQTESSGVVRTQVCPEVVVDVWFIQRLGPGMVGREGHRL